jgi:hypothetical protein
VKNNDKNSSEPVDKQSFKKKFLMRKQQEQEAEKEIDEYRADESGTDRLDGVGPLSGERRSGKLS